jgi:hypothetical protein
MTAWNCAQAFSAEYLERNLPLGELRAASHRFDIRPINYSPRYGSKIRITGTGNGNPFWILYLSEECLGDYAITHVEIAADSVTTSQEEAEFRQRRAIELTCKPRHHRGHLWVEFEDQRPPRGRGLLRVPTVYFEGTKSTMRFKAYVREDKLLEGRFGDPLLRLEWTLKDTAIKRHLGGNKLEHLRHADLRSFVQQNLQLEEIDYARLGPLLCRTVNGRPLPRRPSSRYETANTPTPVDRFQHPAYLGRRAAFLALRVRAYRELKARQCGCSDTPCPKCEFIRFIWLHSPAQLRGLLRGMRGASGTDPITDYRIEGCFRRRHLRVLL